MNRAFFHIGLLLLCGFLATSRLHADEAAAEMAEAARGFLSSLKEDQRAAASFALKSDERLNWHFIPRDRKGLPIKEMTGDQRKKAHALLQSGLSQSGYAKATNVMLLEQVLQDMEGANRRFSRDPNLYFVSIFGEPAAKGTWGWRVEGHHLAVNFTIVKGEFVSGTPLFYGANPAEVRSGPRKGLRILAAEEDLGRELAKSLTPEQRKAGIVDTTAPRDIITGADRKANRLKPEGIAGGELSGNQRELLLKLIKEYVNRHRPELAESDLRKLQGAGGVAKVHFAWAGGLEPGQGHYYRVQGPTFLLEYDNTQNDANHIHSVWRDFENDFGEDYLRKHYNEVPHR